MGILFAPRFLHIVSRFRLLFAGLLASVVMLSPRSLSAQSETTASKNLDLSPFAAYTHASTGYAGSSGQGITFGLDITRYFHFPVIPSLETRVNLISNSVLRQRSYLFGLKLEPRPLAERFHPYADVLAGPGNIHFTNPADRYAGDNAPVYSFGGGLDLDLTQNISTKIDFQHQSWNFGSRFQLAPNTVQFGITYHILFKPHNR